MYVYVCTHIHTYILQGLIYEAAPPERKAAANSSTEAGPSSEINESLLQNVTDLEAAPMATTTSAARKDSAGESLRVCQCICMYVCMFTQISFFEGRDSVCYCCFTKVGRYIHVRNEIER